MKKNLLFSFVRNCFINLRHISLFYPNSLLEQAEPKLESLEATLDIGWLFVAVGVHEQVTQVASRMEPKLKARKIV